MNLRVLSNEAMIAISGFLLFDAKARAVLNGHPLADASREHLLRAHELMVALIKQRSDIESEIDALTRVITELDHVHDRKARSFYYYLHGLREGSDDENLAALCEQLIERCFPQQLDVVNSAYVDEAGWARTVRHMIDAPTVARLQAITVGPHTMAEILHSWLDAGETLGERVFERDQVKTAGSLTGTAAPQINMIKVRSLWIRVTRAFLTNVDLLPLTEEQRDVLLSPIKQSIARALAGDATDVIVDAPAGADVVVNEPDAAADVDPSMSGEPTR